MSQYERAAFVLGAPLCVTSFAPRTRGGVRCTRRAPVRTNVSAALDPSFIHHVPPTLHGASHLLAAVAAVVSDTATATGTAGADAATAAGTVAETAKSGPIQSLANVIEGCLNYLHVTLKGAGVPGAYGISIIAFTGVVKLVLFPVNWKQMESTIKLQEISPKIKAIQAEYKDNPAVINQMTAKLYKDEDVNPLLGCLPLLAQLPIWLALYRALQNMAKEDILNEPFLWIPSLQGPVSQVGTSLSTWLFPLVDGAPPIGWHDALAYLTLPALIVFSQIITTKVISPPSNDPSQQQASAVNNVLPLIVGFFVLNVPAALGLYMFTNNVFSTAQTVIVRKQLGSPMPAGAGGANGAITVDGESVNGLAEAPDGFEGAAQKPKPKKSGKQKRRKRR